MGFNWKFWQRKSKPDLTPAQTSSKASRLTRALSLAEGEMDLQPYKNKYPIKEPEIYPGVVPTGVTPAVAMDANAFTQARAAYFNGSHVGFPGFPRLAMLDTIAEYRAMSSSLATELTREWIVLNSTDTAGDETKRRITELTQDLKTFGIQSVIRKAAEHDCKFGRAQIFFNIKGHENKLDLPLLLSNKTIAKDSFLGVSTVEAIWTTPSAYDALKPQSPYFYRPVTWFMMGQKVHSSRLLTVITRELPDMLKPAFDFAGMSLYQLAEPYIDNWLRTRQSVSDLISNFSITALATSMDQALNGDDEAAVSLFARIKLFIATRSNKGVMILDKEREELVQQNVPLASLDKLQAQAQEHMCSVSRMPAIVLTGISPTGLNASSDGEIRTFYDWIAAQQEAFWRSPIETILKVMMLSRYGEIDPDIVMSFQPLYQMTPKELAEIRTADATTDGSYIDRGVVSPEEVRAKLARNPESGYQGLQVDEEPGDEG